MINLLDLQLNELEDLMKELGQPKFRATQVFGWLYKDAEKGAQVKIPAEKGATEKGAQVKIPVEKGATGFDQMTNLPSELRQQLAEISRIDMPQVLRVQESKLDGTRKYLFGLADGNAVESVFMRYKFGNSICVSSQAGCRMGCSFCASTLDGLARNLTAGEIAGQILSAERDTGERISHVVVMGSGEPFDNYENLSSFIRIINNPKGMNIGMRNITVSTCGIAPMIERFGDDFPQVNLAISLHASNNERRSSLMPVNKRYPLEELIDVCKRYTKKTSRRVTFEYTLVKGINDSEKDADQLAALLRGLLCHVNLIPLNRVTEKDFDTTGKIEVKRFRERLELRGIPATVRRELGDDIDAACGQLRRSTAEK